MSSSSLSSNTSIDQFFLPLNRSPASSENAYASPPPASSPPSAEVNASPWRPNIASWNANSVSFDVFSDRKRKVKEVISGLMRNHDLVFIQETKLSKGGQGEFRRWIDSLGGRVFFRTQHCRQRQHRCDSLRRQ